MCAAGLTPGAGKLGTCDSPDACPDTVLFCPKGGGWPSRNGGFAGNVPTEPLGAAGKGPGCCPPNGRFMPAGRGAQRLAPSAGRAQGGLTVAARTLERGCGGREPLSVRGGRARRAPARRKAQAWAASVTGARPATARRARARPQPRPAPSYNVAPRVSVAGSRSCSHGPPRPGTATPAADCSPAPGRESRLRQAPRASPPGSPKPEPGPSTARLSLRRPDPDRGRAGQRRPRPREPPARRAPPGAARAAERLRGRHGAAAGPGRPQEGEAASARAGPCAALTVRRRASQTRRPPPPAAAPGPPRRPPGGAGPDRGRRSRPCAALRGQKTPRTNFRSARAARLRPGPAALGFRRSAAAGLPVREPAASRARAPPAARRPREPRTRRGSERDGRARASAELAAFPGRRPLGP